MFWVSFPGSHASSFHSLQWHETVEWGSVLPPVLTHLSIVFLSLSRTPGSVHWEGGGGSPQPPSLLLPHPLHDRSHMSELRQEPVSFPYLASFPGSRFLTVLFSHIIYNWNLAGAGKQGWVSFPDLASFPGSRFLTVLFSHNWNLAGAGEQGWVSFPDLELRGKLHGGERGCSIWKTTCINYVMITIIKHSNL